MDIVFANTTAVVSHPKTGAPVGLVHGTHWPADDPIVRAYPAHFDADPRYGLSSSQPLGDDGYPISSSSRAVEETTAAPGEKRTRKRAAGSGEER